MSGRRLHPTPAGGPAVADPLVDPSLAAPQDFVAPEPSPELKAAQQQLAAAAMGISVEQLQALGDSPEPFAAFHDEDAEAVTEEEVTELTPEERSQFVTVMTIGKRSKVVEIFGHHFAIESLNGQDDLKIGLFCKEYRDAPPADSRSYQIAVCAAGLRTVDNRPVYVPISQEEDVFLAKANVLMKWYPPVITAVYRAILELDREFAELSEKLKKSKGSAPSTS